MDDAETGTGPLAGHMVVDLSRALAGPHAAMMLGDLGARVIKVEAPGRGDESRGWGPPFAGPDNAVSTYFLSCNRNKESVTADLKSAAGQDFLRRLVQRADILVENFRTGVLDRFGFSVQRLHELNPGLVILSITGFGSDGPAAGRAGYDQIAQGEAGLMSMTGEPGQPTKVGVPIADLLAGMYGVSGVLAALVERERTGHGRVVRTSLLAAVVGVHAFQGTRWTVAGEVPEGIGNHHTAIAPYGLFQAADGTLQVTVGSEAQWRVFADVVGLDPDDARFATNAQRVHRRAELIEEIERVFSTAPTDHWLRLLEEADIASGKVRTLDQVYEWEQTRSQGLLIDVEHPVLGALQLPGPPLRFDGGPARQHAAPPLLGEHDESVRAWLDELDAAS